jgi:hypothetical protein
MRLKSKPTVNFFAKEQLTAIDKSIRYFNEKAKRMGNQELINFKKYYMNKNENTVLKYKELNEYNAIFNELTHRGFL